VKYFFLITSFSILSLTITVAQGDIVSDSTRKIASTIAVPIDIAYIDIEKMLNTSVNGLIYQDDSYTDNDNDQFKIKVWKKNNITIKPNAANQLKIAVPLKVWAEKGVGALGLISYQSTEFELILNFKTIFSITQDWVIRTVTTPDGYTWITKPVLKYKYADVPITPIVANVLDKEHAGFARTIDEQVTKALDMKPYALMVWNLMNTPFQISEEYETWLSVKPTAVQMTPLTALKDRITGTIGLNVISETRIGVKPVIPPPAIKPPNLKPVKTVPDNFMVETIAEISYDNATEIANKQFRGMKLDFLNGKKSVTIEDIQVGRDGQKMTLTTKLSGNIKGNVIIEGAPYYDSLAQRLALKNVDFQLKSKNFFQRTAAWLFNGKIEGMIEKDYGVPVGDMITSAKTSLLETLNSNPHPGVRMKGMVTAMKPTAVILNDTGITIPILTAGKVAVTIVDF